MAIRPGDKVRFLNDVGEGRVIRIMDRKMVSVLNEYGFEVPMLINELVVIEPAKVQSEDSESPIDAVKVQGESDQSKSSESNSISDKNAEPDFSARVFDTELKLYFGIVPQSQKNNSFDLYLINDCGYNILFTFSFRDDDKIFFLEANKLEPDTKILLYAFKPDQLNQVKELQLQALVYTDQAFVYKKPVDASIPFHPVKFFKENSFIENEYFDENAIIITILEEDYLKDLIVNMDTEDLKEIIHAKEIPYNPIQKNEKIKLQKEFEDTIEEVDLHIHQLIDRVEGLENGEKLEIQLRHFESKLNEAMLNRKKKIVFIHGVGNGVLKVRLRNILDTRYKHLKYQDASFQQYGFGATLVFLRK